MINALTRVAVQADIHLEESLAQALPDALDIEDMAVEAQDQALRVADDDGGELHEREGYWAACGFANASMLGIMTIAAQVSPTLR